uniref:Uncharacterized protein n=1 Tax=Rhizophagus irregularis (strain DAOM 181602 / DAOM 197198 / MUCL 43194) TaxID=747089 RepID=U9TQY5_RHIID
MTCSKIFSGNLPELTENIIKYFRNDFSTLYSCALVNRFWCRLTIPLLWENPFLITENSFSTRNYGFIGIYLLSLNGELKTKFNKFEINDNLLSSNTLFNYPSFIKYLNMWKFIHSIKRWSEDVFRKSKYKYPLEDLGSESDFGRLIQTSLLKIFIENEINIHTLEIEIKTHNYNHCSNTLNSITLYRVNFKDASSKVDESLLLLLRKFGGYLENFRSVNFLSKVEQQKILESVIEYCKNIKLLGIYNMNDEIVYPVLNLIENMKQNLNCLSICCESDEVNEFKLHNIEVQKYNDLVIDNRQLIQIFD